MYAWTFIISLLNDFPWLLIALAALFALVQKKKSPPLILQLLGAAGTIIALPVRALIILLLTSTRAPAQTMAATATIMAFLTFALLLLFAVGYAWEKLARK